MYRNTTIRNLPCSNSLTNTAYVWGNYLVTALAKKIFKSFRVEPKHTINNEDTNLENVSNLSNTLHIR